MVSCRKPECCLWSQMLGLPAWPPSTGTSLVRAPPLSSGNPVSWRVKGGGSVSTQGPDAGDGGSLPWPLRLLQGQPQVPIVPTPWLVSFSWIAWPSSRRQVAPPAFPSPGVMVEWSDHLLSSLLPHVHPHFQVQGKLLVLWILRNLEE